MPFKANAARRHHIPKQKRKVTNWADYNASLCRRGSLTLWFSEKTIAGWRAAPRTTRGGQACNWLRVSDGGRHWLQAALVLGFLLVTLYPVGSNLLEDQNG
jgi:hypothetical protein